MAEVVVFHHALGVTPGMQDFAETLRAAGHAVRLPDLFDGRVFDDVRAGVAHAQTIGYDERAERAVEDLPGALVYVGFSLGVMPAQRLAQNRPGARGAVLAEAFASPRYFGSWPDGVPFQVHGADGDPFFAGDGDLDAAREAAGVLEEGELFVYPGDQHLFTDPSLPSYDAEATTLFRERVLGFLARIDG